MLRRSRSPLPAVAVLAVALSVAGSARAEGAKECLEAVARAQSLRDEHKLSLAKQQLLVCSAATCPKPVRQDCTQWLVEIERQMPSMIARAVDGSGNPLADTTVRIDGATVADRIDGRAVVVDPGSHVIRFERPGMKPVEQTVAFKEGDKNLQVSATLEPAIATPGPPPEREATARPIPIGSWIGWGVGAVGLVGFGIFGTKANLDYGSLEDSCGNRCPESDRDSVQTTMTIADISLVIGLVGAGVGTVLYLMRPSVASRPASAASATSANAPGRAPTGPGWRF